MEKHYEISKETEIHFKEIIQTLAFPTDINFGLIGDQKQKQLIKISKANDVMKFFTQFQVIVSINEDVYDAMIGDKEKVDLLIKESLNGLSINPESGAIKITKMNLVTDTAIIERFGIEEVKNAKDLERLCLEQIKEKEVERDEAF